MLRTNETALSKRRLRRLLPCLVGSLALAGAAGAAQSQAAAALAHGQRAAAVPTTYCIINLGTGTLPTEPVINARGQVAFTMAHENQISRAFFYDGTAILDLGTLGGERSFATALNDAGQVAGFSFLTGDQVVHSYVWTPRKGMVDLGVPTGAGNTSATAINNRGQVTGSWSFESNAQAFRWSAADGMEDLGLGPFIITVGRAINAAGTVAGNGYTADLASHAFVWSRKTGLVDLGTLGGIASEAVAVGDHGQVAGNAALPDSSNRAFIWTHRGGMQDLGTSGGVESLARAMSGNGHLVGITKHPTENGTASRGFSWTRATGMVSIGTLGGAESTALGVNNKGQVVGWSYTHDGQVHAMVWTAKEGVVDLNTRLRDAPPGLVLYSANAISNNGAILARSNAGLLLLKPDDGQ